MGIKKEYLKQTPPLILVMGLGVALLGTHISCTYVPCTYVSCTWSLWYIINEDLKLVRLRSHLSALILID